MHVDEIAALGAAGRKLWESLHDAEDAYALTALIIEAARVKDRLDAFARLLDGDEDVWLRLVPSRGDVEVLEVRPDAALQESRQQATLLRQLVSEINRQKAGQGVGEDDNDDLAGL